MHGRCYYYLPTGDPLDHLAVAPSRTVHHLPVGVYPYGGHHGERDFLCDV